MNYDIPAFEALLMDQEAGASSLLYRFIGILYSVFQNDQDLAPEAQLKIFTELYVKVIEAHPMMAIFPNLSKFIHKGIKDEPNRSLLHRLDEYKEGMNRNIEQTIMKSAELFGTRQNIFTFSHSSIVRKALLEIRKHRKSMTVTVLESRPMREGVMLAKVLSRADIQIDLYADAAMERALENADLVMVGTDWYWEGGFVNKIGTHAILRIAREKGIPFVILTDSGKAMTHGPDDWSRDTHAASVIFAEDEGNINVLNPYFEAMDFKGVSHFIVDGELHPVPGGTKAGN